MPAAYHVVNFVRPSCWSTGGHMTGIIAEWQQPPFSGSHLGSTAQRWRPHNPPHPFHPIPPRRCLPGGTECQVVWFGGSPTRPSTKVRLHRLSLRYTRGCRFFFWNLPSPHKTPPRLLLPSVKDPISSVKLWLVRFGPYSSRDEFEPR